MRSSPIVGPPEPPPSVAPAAVAVAPLPAMGTIASLARMGPGMNVARVGAVAQPLHSTGTPSSAPQAAGATNPFLL
ncbi:hypothetical protein lerEdw1_001200 [Lerista edwardsae]|nr:hypothetical protein lerEdw1_001203 [Lerista edwardsae]KAJ6651004.1 hypothetical protein lerEdw1_001200 [Lerista edwardsae]